MRKKTKVIMIIFFILILAVWFMIEAETPEVLPVGSQMPSISYVDKIGNNLIYPNSVDVKNIPTVIIYFSTKCQHCLYQIEQLSVNIEKFENTNILLVTSEVNLFSKPEYESWKKLYVRNNIFFGIVSKSIFKDNFGNTNTPSIFVFDKNGKLVKKIYGEIRISKLLDYTKI